MSVQLGGGMLVAVLLAAIRAAAWLTVSPPFSTRALPAPARALLSVGIALPVVPQLAGQLPDPSTARLLLAAGEQVLVGAALGFVTAVLFAAVQAAGDLIDLFGGFSLAFAFDPLSATGNSAFGRFYGLMATTLLFASDGYLLVLRGFARSYEGVPLDQSLALAGLAEVLTAGLADLFVAGLQIAGPLIAVLFCADLALGLLNRAAPALNAFAMGFPVKIMLTLSLAGFAVLLLPDAVGGLLEHAVRVLVRSGGG
ncbi:MAG: flagellar biosynthetic protein FliR [Actinobacteria bacterium]|nr:flagellar biosynthetic protein FliR [Actinomycetota bacterium]